MGFMGGVFKVLGFEGDANSKKKKNNSKASYKLKDDKNSRPNQIDGVPVYYPEKMEQTIEFLEFLRDGKTIIVSLSDCDEGDATRSYDYMSGFANGVKAKIIALNDKKLYLCLPEGMEIEK